MVYKPGGGGESRKVVYCPDCARFMSSGCPYPLSNITSRFCRYFAKNLCDTCKLKNGCPNGMVSYGIPLVSCPVGIYERVKE